MINNRQAGRRRGRGGNNGGGNGQRQGGSGRPDSGNRIDSRARGNANQLYEKYKNLASDAQRQGDRVNTEYYLQFADHYFRVLSESRNRFEEQNPQARRQPRDDNFVNGFDSDFDGDDEYASEGDPIRAGERSGEDDASRSDHRREGRRDNRDNQAREGQSHGTRREGRYRDGNRDEGQQREAREGGERDERDGNRREIEQDGNRDAPREPRADRPRRMQPTPVAEETETASRNPQVANDVADAPAEAVAEPRRRGRPRRVAASEVPAADVAPAAMDADRLPPSLSLSDQGGEAAAEEKPRRRRLRTAAGGEATSAS